MTWAASQPDLRKKCVVNVAMPGAGPSHELFIPSLPPAGLPSCGRYPKSTWDDHHHLIADLFSNGGVVL
jgi:hypothetical protein